MVTFTDSDADSSRSSGTFTITVQDDVPVLTTATVSDMVEEDDLNSARGSATTRTIPRAHQHERLAASLVSVGADEPGSFRADNDVRALEAQGLTSRGVGLVYRRVATAW